MKTAELTSELLDHWVAKSEGWTKHQWSSDDFDWRLNPTADDDLGLLVADLNFKPSTDWAQGGPIIERESIALICCRSYGWLAIHDSDRNEDGAPDNEAHSASNGPTPLIAAMRAYVTNKFGEEVPDEIT